ncbi:LysR substrate-binding domain-containing protein [Undibacterium sp. Rencai35W]|uniref:LysR substrate-binding domain-containing protein n=1 Tax=Undibacterium sp. Rencai35W TaxID=3413046 RepID=UPI003BF37900
MIQFRQIEAFRCLMIAGTSVGAARKMNITQPAISRLIADLEETLGFRLFNRDKGRLEPTLAGVRFYSAVEENFLGLERLSQVASNIRNEAPQGITIACLPILSSSILPLILREFFKYHQDVPVTVDSSNAPEILVRLQDQKVDMAICMAFPPLAGIEQEIFKEASVMCAMPVGHHLTSKEVIEPMDLDGEDIIGFFPIVSQSYELETLRLSEAGSRPIHRVKTQTSHTRYAMVANGLGVSIVEPFGAKLWLNNGVVVRPFSSDIRHQYVLACPSGGKRSELMHDFREAVLKVAKDYDFGVEQ